MKSVAQLLNGPSCSRVVGTLETSRYTNVPSSGGTSTSGYCHPSHQTPHFPYLPKFQHSSHRPSFQPQCHSSSTPFPQNHRVPCSNALGKATPRQHASASLLTSSLTTTLVSANQSGIFGKSLEHLRILQRQNRGQTGRGGALVTTNAMQMTRLKPPEETAAPPGQKQMGYPQHVKFAIDEICELAPRASLAKAMGNIQTKLSPGDWQYVFKELQQRRDWQRASRVFKYMQRQPINQPTEHLYTLMMSIFGREGMLDKAQEVFDEMPRYGVPRNVYSYTALINAYGKNAQYPRSLELLADMKRVRIMPNVVTYNTIINACAKGGYEWEGLLDLFGQMRHEGIQPDLITYNTLIAACADRGLLEQAGMIFKVMIEAGCIPDTLTYTSLMAAFSSEERYNDMADLLFWMEDVGTLPDVTAYNILINAYGKAGQFREASATFKRMKRAGVSPTVVTYSTLLDALGKYGQYESVREIFREMVASECAPNVVTFNTMIDAFGRGGHYKEAVDLFESMEETGVEADHITYKGLLAACGMGGLARDAAKLERHIRRRGFPATVDMYNSMIEAYSKAALYEEALSVLDGMTESKVEPDEATYSLLLGMFGKAGLHREAAEMFWKMHDRGFLPGVPTYNALIDAYGRGGLLEEAEHVYEDMLEAKKAPSLGTFAALSAAIAAKGDGESAGDLYSDMVEGGYKPDGPPFCNLIAAYAKIRDVDNVARLLREMAAPRQSLEVSTLAGLLVGRYDDDYRWQEVEFVLEAQRDRGLSDNMVFYNALLDALWELGQHARAVKLVRAALARGTFPEAVKRSDMIWAIDVHRMSGGAALALLYSWLGEMRALRKKRVKKGEEPPPESPGIPDTLSVVAWVGLSKASPRDVPVYQAINVALTELAGSTSNYPFQPAPWSEGRWIASGPSASKWLAGVKLGRKLELDDAPLPELFVDIVERGALR